MCGELWVIQRVKNMIELACDKLGRVEHGVVVEAMKPDGRLIGPLMDPRY